MESLNKSELSMKERIQYLEKNEIIELPSKHFPSFLSYTIYYIIRVSILFIFFQYLGFIYGLISTFVCFIIYKYLMKHLFKLEFTNIQDKVFINQNSLLSINICGVIYIKDFDKEEIRKTLVVNVFNRIPKMKASLVAFLADFYWNTPQVSMFSKEKSDEIINKRIIDVQLDNEECLHDYMEKEVNKTLNPFITPIEYHIIEYKNSSDDKDKKGCVFMKVEHSFSDGLGLVSLFGIIEDEFSIDKYPRILRRKINKVSYYFKLLLIDMVKGLTIGLYSIFKLYIDILFNKKSYIPFNEAKKKNPVNSGITLLSKGLTLNLKKLKTFSKKNKTSINDLFIYSLFKSLKEHSPESKTICALIPVGISNLPNNATEVQLYNKASCYIDLFELPDSLLSNENKSFKLIDMINNVYKANILDLFNYITGEFCHYGLLKYFQKYTYPEMAISNIPGHEKHVSFGKCLVTNLYAIPSCGALNAFCAATSYCDYINFQFCIEKNMNIDPDVIMNKVNRICNEMMDSVTDQDIEYYLNKNTNDNDLSSFNSKKAN